MEPAAPDAKYQGDRVLLLDSPALTNVNDLTITGGDAAGQPGGGIWIPASGRA